MRRNSSRTWILLKLAVDYGLAVLGGLEPGTTAFLVASESYRDSAETLAKEFRLALICLPAEMLRTQDAWAIVSANGTVYSIPST